MTGCEILLYPSLIVFKYPICLYYNILRKYYLLYNCHYTLLSIQEIWQYDLYFTSCIRHLDIVQEPKPLYIVLCIIYVLYPYNKVVCLQTPLLNKLVLFPHMIIEAQRHLYIVVHILIHKGNHALDYICPLPNLEHMPDININMPEINLIPWYSKLCIVGVQHQLHFPIRLQYNI